MSQTEKVIWMFRCTEYQYAKSFVETGTMKLNTPKKWIEMEQSEGKGRGDLLEGIFATTAFSGFKDGIKFGELRKNPTVHLGKNVVYYRSKDILNLPCYCLYGLFEKSFKKRYFEKVKAWATTEIISTSYFKDFYKHESRDSIKSLPKEEQPVVVIIQSPKKFFDQVYSYFESIGINRSEVLIQSVSYIDKSQPFMTRLGFPTELFLKDRTFEHQSEIRIVLNTKNTDALNMLINSNYIINIGNLEDFTQILDYYLDDMFIELREGSLLYVLPEPVTTKLDDMPKEKILSMLVTADRNYYSEDYQKEHIRTQMATLVPYYNHRFNENFQMSETFWERTQTETSSQ